jgi:hypothetical protein
MTDGTGTQTDEVRAALLTLRSVVYEVCSDAAISKCTRAFNVLSAEIERLTRRVEESNTLAQRHALTIMRLNAALASAAAPDERVRHCAR